MSPRFRCRSLAALLAASLALFELAGAGSARAGCGCEKPPPPPASVRPAVTSPGREITLFHPDLEFGASYRVRFVSGGGAGSANVTAVAVLRRDLADGSVVPQLALPLPQLPLGPARIEVRGTAPEPLLVIDDADFTVAPPPIPILTGVDRYEFRDVRAAVGRDGTVYVALDFTDVQQARVFRAQALGYPLRFDNEDLAFWNVQGFLMQLLGERMPGLYALAGGTGRDSDRLQYSRHEFLTYLLSHEERAPHSVDPADPNWHLDGSRHVDHDHQILAIGGTLASGEQPAPGSTPPFDLVVETSTLFHHGLFADERVEVKGTGAVDSYDSRSTASGASGDVRSNGSAVVEAEATVAGNVSGDTVQVLGTVTGEITQDVEREELLPVAIPGAAVNLGALRIRDTETYVLPAGSYRAVELVVEREGRLVVDNVAGPVTLYVERRVDVSSDYGIATTDPDPERFALYIAGKDKVRVSNEATVNGVIYAPAAEVEIVGSGEFFGAFVGKRVKIDGQARVHYDVALRASHAPSEGSGSKAAIEILRARSRPGKVRIVARSSALGLVPLLVSVEGLPDGQPMRWRRHRDRWTYEARVDGNLAGRTVTVRGVDGSAASAVLR
jgi:cytoskeletal protein CcmA (bactofilin family)